MAQSNTILRYIGKLTKLYPEDPLQSARVDELLDAVEDLILQLIPSMKEQDKNKQKEMREQLVKEVFPKWFNFLEKRVSKFGDKNFAVGDSITIADFKIASFAHRMTCGAMDHVPTTVLDQFPHLISIRDQVLQHEKIKEWFEKNK